MTVVQPANSEETQALLRWAVEEASGNVAIRLAIGPSPRRIELPTRPSTPGRGTVAARGQRTRVLFAYGPVMLHEALTAAELLGEAALQVVNMPWLNRVDPSWLAELVEPFAELFVVEDHAPVGALGDALRRDARRSGADGVRRRGLAGVRDAARGAALPRPRRLLARRPHRARAARPHGLVTPVWLVLPDPFSSRLFFDTGIVDALARASRRPARALPLDAGEQTDALERARGGHTRHRRRGRSDARAQRLPRRRFRRIDRWLDRRIGFYPLSLRQSLRHGFNRERMQPGHQNWFLDPDARRAAAALALRSIRR